MNEKPVDRQQQVLILLDQHYDAFYAAVDIARSTQHPVPVDSRGWSQIIVSVITGIKGLKRMKGADFEDGSDVKAANTWEAIDTPRFNGVIKAGTKAALSGKLGWLDKVPYIFFVLWDHTSSGAARCRIWFVSPQHDPLFRKTCQKWYGLVDSGGIISTNFQLHPPRGLDTNVIRNTCGNLSYPLLFCAERSGPKYVVKSYNPERLKTGKTIAA